MKKFLENSDQNSIFLPIQAPSASKNLAQLVLIGEEHSGRDEMNLAGHPFALLQAPGRVGAPDPIFYEWPRTLADGKKVTASWRVEPGAQSGMPGPNEELLYLVMLQMTREAAEEAGTPRDWPQVVHFSRGEMLRRLEWNDGPRERAALETAFARLTAVLVTGKWAFHDAHAKAPMESVMFHILSGVGIAAEPRGRRKTGALPLSWWKWDDVLYQSFLAGNVRSLALDFTLSLQSPTARRLFRLLEAFRHADKTPRREFAIGTFKLRDRLGMTAYKHQSKIKEKLLGGIKELQASGYLADVEWEKARDGSPLAVFRFGRAGVPPTDRQNTKAPGTGANRPQTASAPLDVDKVNEPRRALTWAREMSEVYGQLPADVRLRLLEAAREQVGDAFWDRIEVPESPMSLGLWEMVERETT